MTLRNLPHLLTPRLELRLANDSDVKAMVRYFEENRSFFKPFEPTKPEGFYTEKFWKEQLRRSLQEFYADQSVRFFAFRRPEPFKTGSEVLGTVNFTAIARGPFQACYLGYGLSQRDQGQGLMSEALRAGIGYVWSELGLHRIMANYMPRNDRSARVLKKLGFVVEGHAKDYLQIDGKWEDHVLTSLLHADWKKNHAT